MVDARTIGPNGRLILLPLPQLHRDAIMLKYCRLLADPALVGTLPWSPGLLLSPLVFICTLLTVQNMGGYMSVFFVLYMSETIIGYFQTVIHCLEIK